MEKKLLVGLGIVALVLLSVSLGLFGAVPGASVVSISEVRLDESRGGFLITKTIDLSEDVLFAKDTTLDLGNGKSVKTRKDVLIKTRPIQADLQAPAFKLLREGNGNLQYAFSDKTCDSRLFPSGAGGGPTQTALIPYGFSSGNIKIAYSVELYSGGVLIENKTSYFGGSSLGQVQANAPSVISLYGGKVIVSNIGTLGGSVQLPELSDVMLYKRTTDGIVSGAHSKAAFFSSVLQRICSDTTHDAKFECQQAGSAPFIGKDCEYEARINLDALIQPGGYGGFKSFYSFDGVTGKWALYPDSRPLLATIFIASDVADAVFIPPKAPSPNILGVDGIGAIAYNGAKHFCASVINNGDEGVVEVTATSSGNVVSPSVQKVSFARGQTLQVCFDQFGQQAGSWTGKIEACGISQFLEPKCSASTYGYTVDAPTAPGVATPIVTPVISPNCEKGYHYDVSSRQCVKDAADDSLLGLVLIIALAIGGYLIVKRVGKK